MVAVCQERTREALFVKTKAKPRARMAPDIASLPKLRLGGKSYGGLRPMTDFSISPYLVVVPEERPVAAEQRI